MIDLETGWFEIQNFEEIQSIAEANIANPEWFLLSRYPWPNQKIYVR
jgi:hypothetical protein